jgi:hypothetical protein
MPKTKAKRKSKSNQASAPASWLDALEAAQAKLAAAAHSVPSPEEDAQIHALYYHAGQTIKEAIAAGRSRASN